MKVKTMPLFIAIVLLAGGVGANAFEQGQANPTADSFLDTVAEPRVVEGPFGVDLVK